MISSLKNRKVAAAARLKKRTFRERERSFLVEGARALAEAISSGPGLDVLFCTRQTYDEPLVEAARKAGSAVELVSEEVMAHLTSTVTPQGLVGVARFVDAPLGTLPEHLRCVPVLCAVRDPGNAGTVLRSADAAGADAVLFSSSSVDVFNTKAVRASAGSLFHLPVVRGIEAREAASFLRERGLALYAASAKGEEDIYALDLTVPCGFLFGNEAWGLEREVLELSDATVRIPLAGRAESLNLAAAATIFLFEWARQLRRAAATAGGGRR